MIIRYSRIFVFFIPLLTASIPTLVLAEGITTSKTGALACGDAVLTIKTTYLDAPGFETQVLDQRLTLRRIATNQQKELKTDAKYVIKHLPEKRKVLDVVISSWACIKSKQGKYYFELAYHCTWGEEKGICARQAVEQIVELFRTLREDGSTLIKGPWRLETTRADRAVYRSLGLYEATKMIQLKEIDE